MSSADLEPQAALSRPWRIGDGTRRVFPHCGRQQMFEFILAVFLLEVTPGPNMAYLATLALARGRAAGLCATLGVALGLGVHALVTVFGAGTLIQHYPWLYEALRWAGVAYLLFLAWQGWWPERENSPVRADLL